ncbi:UNVERIFIED_CONTAM: Pentatricopeptide repeat-containing protein, chloroplastic [Sesamum radiatum]|uniref:adenylate kinase n=1 Tax=Sesamum radiatum TaxID=300843 RepID=A0AAW2KCU2_SESRA
MWRRVASLSPLVSRSKSRLLDQVQVANGFNVWQMFSTQVLNPTEGGVSDSRRTPFVTFVLGGPGSGKGTQCTRIVETFGFTHLSAGDLLRKEISSNSENGSMILNTIREGKIVPSEVTVKLIQKAIEASENDRFLIDGFPRSEENRIAYERVIGAEPDIVLFFDCPVEEMVKRVLNRNQGRVDDNIDTVKERLKVFTELNLPVIKYYSEKGKLYKNSWAYPREALRKNVGISSKLLRLYACNGQVEKAHEMFDVMPDRNSSAFPWNSLISGYAEEGMYEDALAFYFQMVEEGVEPDQYTFPRVLKACGGVGMIQVGEEVHRHVIRFGFGNNTFVLNALGSICMLSVEILLELGRHGLIVEAMSILRWMIEEGCEPDSVTLSAVLTSMSPYKIGTQIHGWVFRRGTEWNLSVANSLIVFYSNQEKLEKVKWLFECMPQRDVVSWNSIISAHSKDSAAVEYFNHMMDSDASPDGITFVPLLSACAHLGMVKNGERMFSMMVERYQISPSMEHYACMVNLYARAGLLSEAYDFVVNRMEIEAGPTVWERCCMVVIFTVMLKLER